MNVFRRFTVENLISGQIIPINKPYGWTSFDVVNKLRVLICKTLNIDKIKVGHAGTLDPLATGLLLLCTGKMTKEIESLQKLDKTYTGVMFLGATTPSFDKETEIDATFPVEHIQDNDIKSVCSKFTGNFLQLPPVFSAIKIKGKRAYIYARKNQKIELQPREVTISEFDICAKEFPKLSFHVKCSKGTYIRSLTRDVGIALNSGAYLESLCRNAIGNFNLSDAFQLNEIEEMLKK